MVFAMSKSNLIAFRIPSELQDEFNRSVLASGGDKTSWLVDAIRMKLGQPEKSIDSRMLGLVERMAFNNAMPEVTHFMNASQH